MPQQLGEQKQTPNGLIEWDGTNWRQVLDGGQGAQGSPPQDRGALFGLLNTLGSGSQDLLEGVGKGATSSVVGAGKAMSSPATTWLGNKAAEAAGALGLGPDVSQTAPARAAPAFKAADEATETEGLMQALGGGAEQIGEYFVGAGPARKAAVEGFARLIPNSASGPQMKVLNKLAAILGRAAGEGGSAAATSVLHGETNPDPEALTAAAGPSARAGVEGALSNSYVQQLLAILGAGAPAGLSTTALASRMGTFGVAKRLLADMLAKPGFQRGVGAAVEGGARVGAGLEEQYRKANRQTR